MRAKQLSQVHRERISLQDNIPLKTPLVIYMEPSGYCNLRCFFCPQYNPRAPVKRDIMSIDLFKKLVNDISDFGEKIELLRVCGFGEPLINKDIIEMLRYASNSSYIKRIELISNGTLLSDVFIKEAPEFVDRIIISLEGLNSEDYKDVCDREIDYDKLVSDIKELFCSRKDCILHLKIHHNAVSSKEREKEFLNTFGDYCDEIYIEKLISLWPEFDFDSSNEFRYGGEEVVSRRVCSQMFKGLQVLADGRVLPCCADWQGINVLGDINNESLFKIWNGENLKKLRIEHLKGNKDKIEPCKSCVMNDYCDYDNIDQYADKCIKKL